jgi:hypothetical protein
MANIIRIRRRNSGGAAGAPSSLQQAELAFNEADGQIYVGVGTGGAGGSATTIPSIGGTDWASKTYVTAAVAAVNVSSQLANYLTSATAASTYLTISSASSTYLSQSSASSTYAPLASPGFSGSPTVPNQTAGDSSTKIANTSFVMTAVANLIASSPEALNTLNELAQALGNDASFSTTISNSIGGKLAKASNLSDLTDASAARTNLGLSSMATQSSTNVNITGGSIDGVDLNGGSF